VSTRPPRPARRLNRTVAIVAPRASSFCQTESSDMSSRRAVAAPETCARPRVRTPSDSALPGSLARRAPPRPPPAATCSGVASRVLRTYDLRHRAFGIARQVGHHSARHRARSLMRLQPRSEVHGRVCWVAQRATWGNGRGTTSYKRGPTLARVDSRTGPGAPTPPRPVCPADGGKRPSSARGVDVSGHVSHVSRDMGLVFWGLGHRPGSLFWLRQ
jgi:hypothetical protein